MDFATLIGLSGAMLLIAAAIILGVSPGVFINPASLLIVVGGSFLVVLSKFSFGQFFGAFKAAARAAAVANVLLARDQIQPGRLRVTGLADTEPLEPNTSSASRAKNRRVEIIVDLAGPMQLEQRRLQEMAEQGLTVPDDEPDIDLTVDPPADDPEPQGELTW